MIGTSPLPQIGREAEVALTLPDGTVIPLRLEEPGETETYVVDEPDRFGQKISTGRLQYADYNPYESNEVASNWGGGAGLRRYSDLDDRELALTFLDEVENVDVAAGRLVLAPEVVSADLPGATSTPVWIGHLGDRLYAVAGTKIFYENAGVWVDHGITLPADARKGAVGVFSVYLIVGFGDGATGRYFDGSTGLLTTTGTIQTDTGTPLYVFAFTADRAAAYIAGGTTSVSPSTVSVLSSATGISYDGASNVVCGHGSGPITALAPGGGLAIVYVGKTTEFGQITLVGGSNVYQTLLPYDSNLGTNSQNLQWWLDNNSNNQPAGTVALVFTRERALWTYQPSSESSGQAANISPWAVPGVRPRTQRGLPGALVGSARYLYMAVTTALGRTYLYKQDVRTGHWIPFESLGSAACQHLMITWVFGQPRLYFGYGTDVAYILLPFDGDMAPDDPACRFRLVGEASLPGMDLGFVDEPKIGFTVRVEAENLQDNARYVRMFYGLDGAAPTLPLGTAYQSPSTEIPFDAPEPSFKQLRLKAQLNTTDPTETPEIIAIAVRMSLNPTAYRIWTLRARLPAPGTVPNDGLGNVQTTLAALRAAQAAGVPVIYRDYWNTLFRVRILKVREALLYQDVHRTPEWSVDLTLLETQGIAAATTTQQATLPAGGSHTSILPLPLNVVSLRPGVINTTLTIVNATSETLYPIWTLVGGFYQATLTNVGTGATLRLLSDIAVGNRVTINANPAKRTVVDANGEDRFDELAAGFVFFGFPPGTTQVQVVLGGCTTSTITSYAEVTY